MTTFASLRRVVSEPKREIAVDGLSVLLDEEEDVPYLELTLQVAGRMYDARILVAGDEWAATVRDESGRMYGRAEEFYSTQAGAIVGAMLIALHAGQDSSRAHRA